MMIRVEDSDDLANFMRTVNFQLARYINNHFSRDSQAIRERYKSPVINDAKYQMNVIKYIWLNRHKIDSAQRAENDPFCSACWRLNPNCIKSLTTDNDERVQLGLLLDSYSSLPEPICERSSKKEKKFVRNLLNEAYLKIEGLFDKIFQNTHTIGDEVVTQARAESLSAFRRDVSLIV